MEAERRTAKDPKLGAYLTRLRQRYAREEGRLEEWKSSRVPGTPAPDELLPRSFVGRTERD